MQDLAQDLPQDAVALELVLDRVREHDTTVSDQQARTVLVSIFDVVHVDNESVPLMRACAMTGSTLVISTVRSYRCSSQHRRYFKHAPFIPIVGVRKETGLIHTLLYVMTIHK